MYWLYSKSLFKREVIVTPFLTFLKTVNEFVGTNITWLMVGLGIMVSKNKSCIMNFFGLYHLNLHYLYRYKCYRFFLFKIFLNPAETLCMVALSFTLLWFSNHIILVAKYTFSSLRYTYQSYFYVSNPRWGLYSNLQ